MQRKPTGELQLFKELLEERPFEDFITGKPIRDIPRVHHMAHVLPKSTHPKFRLYKKNIVFLTIDHHTTWDTAVHKIYYHPYWKKLVDLAAELQDEYLKVESGEWDLEDLLKYQ